MHTIFKLIPLLLLTSAISLSSCVNEVKNNPTKTQTQDTLSQLKIVFNIPDSNKILAVNLHAEIMPWKKNYRLDWDFGDSTGIISRFDTSDLTHHYGNYGFYFVTLSIFDTVIKAVLGKTSVVLDLEDNAIDTNFLH